MDKEKKHNDKNTAGEWKSGLNSISSKKESKNNHTQKENEEVGENPSRIKPFINMYDPFG